MDFTSLLPSFKNIQIINEYIKDPKYKTEMCKNWERSGNCPYNSKCRFAHGKKELMFKELEANPNYRAKDCYNFFRHGFCSYGRRCCFKHDERKINEKTQALDIKVLLMLNNPSDKIKGRLSVFEELTSSSSSLRSSCTSASSIAFKSKSKSSITNSLNTTRDENCQEEFDISCL